MLSVRRLAAATVLVFAATLVAGHPAAGQASQQTVTFDAAPHEVPLDGQFPTGLLDWGSGRWWKAGPWGKLPSGHFRYRSQSAAERIRALSPVNVVSIRAWNDAISNATVTVSCVGMAGSQRSATLAPQETRVLAVGWPTPCATEIQIASSQYDGVEFDDLVVSTAGGATTATPTATAKPTSPTATPTATRPAPTPTAPAATATATSVPATPVAGTKCPASVHDAYKTTGPDGRQYATWHPQIDPVHGCWFGHDHGNDPALFDPSYRPAYGYADAADGVLDENHEGFKTYVLPDAGFNGYRWVYSHHFGTSSLGRACNRFHEVQVAVKRLSDRQIVARLAFMADFGAAVSNRGEQPLTPSACPSQAQQAAGSLGQRQIVVWASSDTSFYEPWRADGRNPERILGLSAMPAPNTPSVIVSCANTICDTPVRHDNDPRGYNWSNHGTTRFLTKFANGTGLRSGANTGTFYTDQKASQRLAGPGPGVVQQYVAPGVDARMKTQAEDEECYYDALREHARDASNLGPLITDPERLPMRCMTDAEMNAYQGSKNFNGNIDKGRTQSPN